MLIVDPDPPTASDVKRVLESRGFEILGTTPAASALEVVRSKKPDLVIVESSSAEGHALMRAIRLDRDLEHVHVVQLMERGGHGAP